MGVRKAILIFTGTVCVGLGVLGMFLPLLPTTVFLLMGAYCYSRSSGKFHKWLLTNRLCGKYISNYQAGRGITAGQKTSTILTLWVSIGLSIWLLGGSFWVTVLLATVAIAVTTHITWLKTLRPASAISHKSRGIVSLLLLLAAITGAGCGGGATTSSSNNVATKANAEAILTAMTEKLTSAPAVSFSTTETADRLKRGGEIVKVNVNRSVTFKKPDRMYFKVTGDRDLEVFYDGKTVTLVTHKDKVWGELPAPPTLAETIEKISENYGMPMPVADLFGMEAKGKLRNPANTAAVVKNETVGGVECHVLSFKNPDVDWEVWIPVSGDPLPKKLHTKYKAGKRERELTFEFSDWNFSPATTDDSFVAKVPTDYEGIPIIQRVSSVIQKLQEEEKKANADAKTEGPAKAKKKWRGGRFS